MENTRVKSKRFVYAYDPVIGRRVVHVVVGEWAVSLATGHKFKLTSEIKEKLNKNKDGDNSDF